VFILQCVMIINLDRAIYLLRKYLLFKFLFISFGM